MGTLIVRDIQALPHISRAHLCRVGDGGTHLYLWFFARPEGHDVLGCTGRVVKQVNCGSALSANLRS